MPEAIIMTSTWPRPTGGTSTTSVWNALIGAPYRSRRITDAYMRSGTSPTGGISPSSYSDRDMHHPPRDAGSSSRDDLLCVEYRTRRAKCNSHAPVLNECLILPRGWTSGSISARVGFVHQTTQMTYF